MKTFDEKLLDIFSLDCRQPKGCLLDHDNAIQAIYELIKEYLPEEAFVNYPNTPEGNQAKHENRLYNSYKTQFLSNIKSKGRKQ